MKSKKIIALSPFPLFDSFSHSVDTLIMQHIDENLIKKIHSILLNSFLHSSESSAIKQILKTSCEYLAADLSYWLFLDGATVVSVAFEGSPDHSLSFMLNEKAKKIDTSLIPEKPQVNHALSSSIYGLYSFQSSLQVPLFMGIKLIGLVEFGSFTNEIDRMKAQQIASAIYYIHSVYEAEYTALLRFEQTRQMRTDLTQTERLFHILLENTHDVVLSLNIDGEILTINDVGRSLLGFTTNDTHHFFNPLSPDLSVIIQMIERKGLVSDLEVVAKTSSGKIKHFLASFTAETDHRNSIKILHGLLKDITDRIESQNDLWKKNLELTAAKDLLEATQLQMLQQEKLASIGQLAAGIAHEINNPLGFIISNHETLRDYVSHFISYIEFLEGKSNIQEDFRKEFKVVNGLKNCMQLLLDSDEGYGRISKVIQSLKDFSRMETRGELSLFSIGKLIDDTLMVSRNSWKYVAEVERLYEFDELIEGYGDLLNQVFMNIIVNAAQAIEAMHLSTMGSIIIRTEKTGENIKVVFEDTGPGIPDSIIQKVFDPFFTTKPIGQGTGLGLSVSYDIIVKKHHGKIMVENLEPRGARFTIIIPQTQEAWKKGKEN